METGMNRRTFFKGVAALAGVAAASGIAGCAQPTVGRSEKASADTASVDFLSSSTWRQAPDAITDIAETVDTDIVIVGAGNAGMCAAATAAEAGASVVVLERMESPQDSRSWIGAYNSKMQQEQGFTYDRSEISNDILRYSTYMADQRLINAYLDNSGEMMDWWCDLMDKLGADVMLESASDDYEYLNPAWAHHTVARPWKPEGGNQLYVANPLLLDYCQNLGVDFRFKCAGEQLVQPDGPGTRVTGVIATAEDGSHIQFNAAKGVLVCTGGFAGDIEMLNDLTRMAHRYCTFGMDIVRPNGTGMKMMVWAGADMPSVQETMIFDRGTVMPTSVLGDMNSGGIWYGGSLPFLRVNTQGERFFNEDQLYDWNWNAAVTQPGHTWWQVFDAKYYQDAAKFGNTRCSRVVADSEGCAPNTAWIDGSSQLNEDFLATQLSNVIATGAGVQADTLEGLAEAMGVPVDTFIATVQRYNELAEAGVDEDYGKMEQRLSTIKQGPFTAVHCAGWLLCTLGGVRVNKKSQVLSTQGDVIEGLWTAGNDQGGFYGTTYPETYGGLNMGRNLTFARMAIKQMLGE